MSKTITIGLKDKKDNSENEKIIQSLKSRGVKIGG